MAESPGYEKSDFEARRILAAGAIIIGAILAVAGGAWLAMRETSASPGGPNGAHAPAVDGPALQSDAPADRESFYRQKEAALTSYGWSDRSRSRVHIPIDQAMRELAQPAPEPSR